MLHPLIQLQPVLVQVWEYPQTLSMMSLEFLKPIQQESDQARFQPNYLMIMAKQ